MKTIRMITALILALIMVFTLTACTKNGGDVKTEADSPESVYNLDMDSPDPQPMSEKRATADILKETSVTYLKNLNYFAGSDLADLTYNDIKEHIGIDASEYCYDESLGEHYIWYADGDDNASLNVWFADGKIYGAGAYNL